MKFSLYYHTLKYLKGRQIAFRIFYALRRLFRKFTGFRYELERTPATVHDIAFLPSLPSQVSWIPQDNTFTFLNRAHTFGERINWRFGDFGKLWTYNLHYFEYLHGAHISKDEGLQLMRDFISQLPQTPEALEPYPTALRIIFWIRFIAEHGIEDARIDASLYAQSYILADQVEYHLMGNHLLEDGFGLFFAAYRFGDVGLYRKAVGIILRELDEQILPDGGHFERSPMYHQIILYRVLDCLNLSRSNQGVFQENITAVLEKKAALMLGWLRQIAFRNGAIPLFNDSAFDIAPSVPSLLEYGNRLEVTAREVPLQESGYRKLAGTRYELVADVGEIGPDYIPGHAHSDTLSFELYIDGKPFIVDTGTSTYEKNERRQYERSTAAHNTVQIDGAEQTEIWGGFRVARRARPVMMEERENVIRASHTGYDLLGVRHIRTFSAESNSIQITDEVAPLKKGQSMERHTCFAYLHFHSDVVFTKQGTDFLQTAHARIDLKGCTSLALIDYEYAPAFNTRVPARKAVIAFHDTLKITLRIV